MTTSSRDRNMLALQGWDVTDEEYREEFGIPADVDVNDYMLDKVQTDNENFYLSEGMDENKAKAKARENRMKAEADLDLLLEFNDMK